jgi:hypothetical protein
MESQSTTIITKSIKSESQSNPLLLGTPNRGRSHNRVKP